MTVPSTSAIPHCPVCGRLFTHRAPADAERALAQHTCTPKEQTMTTTDSTDETSAVDRARTVRTRIQDRLTTSRLGKSTMREMDADMLTLRAAGEAIDAMIAEHSPVTDASIREAALAMYRRNPGLSMSGATDLARAALEAARDAE